MSELDQVTPEAEVPAAPAQPEFSIADLQNLRQIVALAAQRGAFQAAEMSSIGAVFDRLNAFLNAVAPAPAADGTEEAPAEAPAGDEQAPAA
jgi:hypothetical protein